MKQVVFLLVLSFVSQAYSQTDIVNMDHALTDGVQDAISEDAFITPSVVQQQRQEQEAGLFEQDLSYQETEEIYEDQIINGYEAREPDDEGTVY